MDAYWRAANYLSVGQIYLYDNPLLKRALTLADVKHMLLGHWGTTPGQNFIYVHLNRVIKKYDLDMIYVSGPGHGGPAVVGNTYLEGTYSEIYPNISRDEAGLRKLFIQFSFPGGIPSHASPECPGSIHEGGELGYSLSHSFGAVFDNPDLIVACVVGDGEAETGPLATAWHSNKFLDPATDGAVLPILHLNGYKISNPTVLARIEHEELEQLLRGYGWTPYFVEGHEPEVMHEAMAAALDTAVEQIKKIQQDARAHSDIARPRWPMIVLNSPKGWTGPKIVDGLQVEGTFRAHQVRLHPRANPEHLKLLEDWLRSYRPEELFDDRGRLKSELAELAPRKERRMGANPHANGGILRRDLGMPDFREYAVEVPSPGVRGIGDTHVLGRFLRDVAKLNNEQRNFRVFGPDETLSNGLEALFEMTKRQWDARTVANDEFLAPTGRVMEMLSEHQCEGWLEGYLLTGRHGLFNCYEAFIHIIDSMFNQHAKWLKVTSHLPWRRKIASLNHDPAKGAVHAPWLAWGPYLWADGTIERGDGLTWMPEDFGPDGAHSSRIGSYKAAGMLLDFMQTDATTRPWYTRNALAFCPMQADVSLFGPSSGGTRAAPRLGASMLPTAGSSKPLKLYVRGAQGGAPGWFIVGQPLPGGSGVPVAGGTIFVDLSTARIQQVTTNPNGQAWMGLGLLPEPDDVSCGALMYGQFVVWNGQGYTFSRPIALRIGH
jgi:xylulose-5-phosphate/fructose-6-phosphate phosphoketolase